MPSSSEENTNGRSFRRPGFPPMPDAWEGHPGSLASSRSKKSTLELLLTRDPELRCDAVSVSTVATGSP